MPFSAEDEAELRRQWERDASDIYVRDEIDGRWGSYSLAELPPDRRAIHVQRWVDEKNSI